MDTVKEMRGHHLGSLLYSYQRTRSIGQYYQKMYQGKVRITASSADEVCRDSCALATRTSCFPKYRDLDRCTAEAFGLQVGEIYDFSEIVARVTQGHIDDRVMALAAEGQCLPIPLPSGLSGAALWGDG